MAPSSSRAAVSSSAAVRAFRSRIEPALRALPEPQPRFAYQIGWSDNYETLFRNAFRDITAEYDLYERARRSGRVILCARGGGAKTVVLQRVAKNAFEAGGVPLFVDLKRWSEPTYTRWKELREDGLERAAFLLSELSVEAVDFREIDSLPQDIVRVVLVDGLNEVRLSTGNEILDALDAYVRRSVNTCTIVTDRLVRREPPNSDRWQLATIRPFDESEIRHYVKAKFRSTSVLNDTGPQEMALLATPYFLDLFLKEGRIPSSSSQAFRHYFLEHVSLTAQELASAGFGAFRAYTGDQSRVFNAATFAADAGELVWQKLRNARAVIQLNGTAFFSHHLKHDFLAAHYVAADATRWNRTAFGIISLGASSFDAIALALEQLPTTEEADRFVRRVYDWNPYAAAYAIAEGLDRLSVQVSNNMQVVMLAMLGERKFDLIQATALRASDALSLFPSENASHILTAPSLQTIFQLLENVAVEQPWFQAWRALFTRPLGSAATNEDIESLFEADSIVGWTAANVLKRLTLTEPQLQSLRNRLANADPTTRWRIVHVLGAFPSVTTVDLLRTSMTQDADEWVRYGAIRSLVEVAALTQANDLRRRVFVSLADSAVALMADRRSLEEFERVIFVRPDRAPADWVPAVGLVVEALYQATSDPEQRSRWRRVAHSLELSYGTGAA